MKMTLSGSSYTERPLSVVPSSLWQWSLVRLFKTHSHSKDGTQEHSDLEEPGIHSFKSEGENTGVEELQGGRTLKLSNRRRCLRTPREADCWPRSSMDPWMGDPNQSSSVPVRRGNEQDRQEAGSLAQQQFPHLQTCTPGAWREDVATPLHLTLAVPLWSEPPMTHRQGVGKHHTPSNTGTQT